MKTRVLRSPLALRIALKGRRVGFVPTMGALHDGHLSLLAAARKGGRLPLVSIFVNPTQFAPGEDLSRYPRDLRGDIKKIQGAGGALVFAPSVQTVYPLGFATRVRVTGPLAEKLEAHFRPGHFDGVATVVARLFGLVGPCDAFFGLKDYQQYLVIKTMVKDLSLPVKVHGMPTLRARDGLALSSRNVYLSPLQRAQAPALRAALKLAASAWQKNRSAREACRSGLQVLRQSRGFKAQYFEAADAQTFGAPQRGRRVVFAAAAYLGKTRLIDNILA